MSVSINAKIITTFSATRMSTGDDRCQETNMHRALNRWHSAGTDYANQCSLYAFGQTFLCTAAFQALLPFPFHAPFILWAIKIDAVVRKWVKQKQTPRSLSISLNHGILGEIVVVDASRPLFRRCTKKKEDIRCTCEWKKTAENRISSVSISFAILNRACNFNRPEKVVDEIPHRKKWPVENLREVKEKNISMSVVRHCHQKSCQALQTPFT